MKNGNGRRRSVVRWVVAVTGTLILTALMFPPPPATAIMSNTPCNQECLADYEEEALKCGKIRENEEAYKTCHDKAYERHKSCRESCTQKENDCLEHCKDMCYNAWEKCRDDCPRGDKNCLAECSNEHGRCIKECEKKCKK